MARRTDDNQPVIAEAFRRAGAAVHDTHALGGGFPDLAVGFRGHTVLVEVKDGRKPPSARRLTPDEEKFAARWQCGRYAVVTNPTEAIRLLESL